MIEWLSNGLFIVGSTLALLAGIGVLRMPDVFTRMQASTKASTLGLGCLLAGLAGCALSACNTSAAADPPNARSTRSETSWRCVWFCDARAAYTCVRSDSSRVTRPFSAMICINFRVVV